MARFLVVDDDGLTVRGMTGLLNADGHDVAPFTAGAHAVEAISRESFDAVVTDLDMPGTDGHSVVSVTREHLPEACLFVVTARADEKRSQLSEAGVCLTLDKPIDYDSLTQAIDDCRARGGPGAHGGCHWKSRHHHLPLAHLRRK